VIDEQENIDLNQYSNEIEEILKDKNFEQKKTVFNQSITNIAPKFIEDKSKKLNKQSIALNEKENNYRIQDQGLQEMKDDGMCLSMHQPWASLLIAGIKKHEGRTWYTPHRGRLWIHAASKQPSESDVSETETFYRHFYSSIT
jgi:activating signal cointegrator 1